MKIRCKHNQCSDCRIKRGVNRGNRNARHQMKKILAVKLDIN